MSSRLTRFSRGTSVEREPSRLVARAADLVAQLAADDVAR